MNGKNGKIIITVPAFPILWSNHDVSHHHVRRYKKKDLINIISSLDLNIELVNYINYYLFPVAFLGRLVSKLFPKKNIKTSIEMEVPKLNEFLKKIFASEKNVLSIKRPFGLSLIFVLTK